MKMGIAIVKIMGIAYWRGYARHQSFWHEAILVEQDIHGTVFRVGKLAPTALAMAWQLEIQANSSWFLITFQISDAIGDDVENMSRNGVIVVPLEWRRASTPLKCSSLNITVKEGRGGGWGQRGMIGFQNSKQKFIFYKGVTFVFFEVTAIIVG